MYEYTKVIYTASIEDSFISTGFVSGPQWNGLISISDFSYAVYFNTK